MARKSRSIKELGAKALAQAAAAPAKKTRKKAPRKKAAKKVAKKATSKRRGKAPARSSVPRKSAKADCDRDAFDICRDFKKLKKAVSEAARG